MKHHYTAFWSHLNDPKLSEWQSQLPALIDAALLPDGNGNLPRWQAALDSLNQLPSHQPHALDQAWVSAGDPTTLTPQQREQLETALRALHPWRKGPFKLFDIEIDTEWHSDWKWDRVLPHLAPLQGKTVLDIGCGSGYHLWRMLGQGARLAIGVDPSLLFMSQFLALKQFIGQQQPAYFLPLTLEQLPVSPKGGFFDTVFSMGVLYHRRSPIDHIYELKSQLKPGGQLVLETLVIDEKQGQLLVPQDRYAQMRNVWFLPSVPELTRWLERCGFSNVRCVDLNQTNTAEQRTTDWMQWNSLESFLDPNDHNLTIEGHPAPLRAVMLCNAPAHNLPLSS